MNLIKASSLKNVQFQSVTSWEAVQTAMTDSTKNFAVIGDTVTRRVKGVWPVQMETVKTKYFFRAAYNGDDLISLGSNEGFDSIGYLIVDLKS